MRIWEGIQRRLLNKNDETMGKLQNYKQFIETGRMWAQYKVMKIQAQARWPISDAVLSNFIGVRQRDF